MLSWEKDQYLGTEAIINKLVVRLFPAFPLAPQFLIGWGQSLPFQTVKHQPSNIQAQPSRSDLGVQSILVLVTGHLAPDDSPNPLQFSQTFQLLPDNGSYYVYNDIFSLVLG